MSLPLISVAIAIVGICFVHYHRKLQTASGRRDVLRELRTRGITKRYIRSVAQIVRFVRCRTGLPFSIQSFGVSMTLAQVYGVVAILLSVVFGGSGMIGDFHITQFSTSNLNELFIETTVNGVILVIIVTVFFLWKTNRTVRSSDFTSKQEWLKYVNVFLAVAFLIGMILGTMSGYVIFMVPLSIGIYALFRLSHIEAVIVTTITMTTVLFSLFGVEHAARYGTPARVSTESWIDHYWPIYLIMLLAFLFIRLLGPYLNGYRGAAWAGTGIALIASFYIIIGRTILGSVSEPMAVILLIWVIVPFVNALNDYLSLGISYLILRKVILVHHHRFIAILGYFILDLLIAAYLMVQCTFSIPLALSATDRFTIFNLNVRAFVEDSANDLYGHGLWIGLMILTTLSYTVIHLIMIVVALFVRLYHGSGIDRFAIDSIQSGADSLLVKLYLSSKFLLILIVWCVSIYVTFLFVNIISIFVLNGETIVDFLETTALYGARRFMP